MVKNKVTLLFLLTGFFILTTCKKVEKVMMVTTGEVANISTNSAEVTGQIIDIGEGATQYGHCYAKTPYVNLTNLKTEKGKPTGNVGFTSSLSNLDAGTKYYIRAYISNGTETVYGNEKTLSTIEASTPTLTTIAITSITTNKAISGGNISIDGGAPITARGVCWNTSPNPTTGNNITSDGSGSGSFSSNISGLTPSTIYYVRSYATNSAGTSYGNELSFSTSAVVVPVLTTTTITNIGQNTAMSGGNISSDGGTPVTVRGICWSISPSPTITNNQTYDGADIGSFTSIITGLSKETTYFVRAYGTNSVGTGYGNIISFTTPSYGTVTDIEGNVYNTVTIGTQIWMKENLETTKYRNGDLIGTTTPLTFDIYYESTPKYQWPVGGDESNVATYGRHYTWYATTDIRNVCPTGWHVPSDTEWTTLATYLGGSSVAGGKLKEAGTAHWASPNYDATNESGFTALPAGFRYFYGTFDNIRTIGGWWGSTEYNNDPTVLAVSYTSKNSYEGAGSKNFGYTVRCIKD